MSKKKNKDLTENLFKYAKMSLVRMPVPEIKNTCERYNDSDYDDYIEDILTEEEKKNFEKHAFNCLYCLQQLHKAYKLDNEVKKSYITSEIGQKRSLLKTLSHVEKHYRDEIDKNRSILLAAAVDHAGSTGIAYGIAVNREGMTGALTECAAWVSEEKYDHGLIEIRGIAASSVREYSVSSPLSVLQELLGDLIRINPVLKLFELDRRHITIHLNYNLEKGIIFEAQSLSLSIIIAIMNAVTGKKASKQRVFSARILPDGSLKSVGSVDTKIIIAQENGIKEIVLSEENRTDCESRDVKTSKLSIKYFSNLVKLFSYLEYFDKLPSSAMKRLKQQTIEADHKKIKQTDLKDRCPWDFVIDAAREKDIPEQLVEHLCEMTERFSQVRTERRPISTSFVLGKVDLVNNILPESPINLKKPIDVFSMQDLIFKMTALVDGENLSFVVSPDGYVRFIRRLNMEIEGDYSLSPLYGGTIGKFCLMSKLSHAIIFHIPKTGNRVLVFDDGKLIGRYKNGQWEKTDYEKFWTGLMRLANREGVDKDVLEKIIRVAIAMSYINESAFFLFVDDIRKIKNRYIDMLNQLSLSIKKDLMKDIGDEDLISFAKEDGAFIIQNDGRFNTFMAFLKPMNNLQYDAMDIGTRHFSSKTVSKDVKGLCVVVSRDSMIRVYYNGKELQMI